MKNSSLFSNVCQRKAINCSVKSSAAFWRNFRKLCIKADTARINLFTNLSLTAMVVRRAIPDTLPLFVPEAADETVDFQINAIVDALEKLKAAPAV